MDTVRIDYQSLTFPYTKAADQDAPTPVRHPVVVVGAGPVGLSAAIDLTQQGVPVVLLDADWLEGCPLFAGIQEHPTFAAIRERVRERADAIWRTAPRRLQ